MKQTLLQFATTDSLYYAALALLEKLNIQIDSETAIPLKVATIYDNRPMPQYLKDALKYIKNTYFIGVANDLSLAGEKPADSLEKIAQTTQLEGKYKGMIIFACDAYEDANLTRTAASALTRAFCSIASLNPVILIIRHGDFLTLSTCEHMDYKQERRQRGGERLGKVTMLRNINCKNLHAGHRQILEKVAKDVKGSISFDDLFSRWLSSFSIDILSDAFFDGYKSIYEDIVEYVTGKRMVKEANKWVEKVTGSPCGEIMEGFARFDNPEKAVRDYVKKLMGRLVFIQFLQKKGWMGVPAGDSWDGGDPDFLQNLFDHSEKQESFIDDVLEPLFNDLNTLRHGDLLTLNRAVKVPYLNGGLFELDDNDDTKFPLPSQYLKKLFDFFSSYNFTIDENAPDDVEIGVDPEMLGRIFENLLEDNKEKGAFYTPKEIVQYMCREALVEYLTTCIIKKQGDGHRPESDIRKYVHQLLEEPEAIVPRMTPEHFEEFGRYIREVKICDPAIGSGAFPMGLLNELVHCRVSIKAWAKDKYGNLLVGDYAALKADIICNNIYGVDIEKGAIDIARLRFWLSIIVDLKMPHALPNFDYKFMQGNSLITTFCGEYVNLDTKNQQHDKVNEMKAEKQRLYGFKQQYYASQGPDKHGLAVEIKKSILRLIAMQIGIESKLWYEKNKAQFDCDFNGDARNVTFSEIKSYLPKDKQELADQAFSLNKQLNDTSVDIAKRAQIDIKFFDWRIMFTEVFEGDNGGFDIVIGNPPYVNIANIRDDVIRKLYQKHFHTVKNKSDLYSIFTEKAYYLAKRNGVCSFIFSNSWMGTDSFSLFRKFLIDYTKIINLVDLPDKVFKNATVRTCIILFSKEIVNNHTINLINYDGNLFLPMSETLTYQEIKVFEHCPFSFEKGIDLYKANHKLLRDIATFTLGIKTSNDRRFISTQPFPKDSYKMVRGRNIQRYNTPIGDEYMWYRPDLFVEKTGAGPRRLEYFQTPVKILIQDVAQEVCATIDECQYLCNDTINVIYQLENGFPFKYVLAILNSKAVRFWHKKIFPEGLHVKKYQLEVIPIPITTTSKQKQICEMVSELIEIRNNGSKNAFFDKESQLDRIIYELFNLTNFEVKMIDPKEIVLGNDADLFLA